MSTTRFNYSVDEYAMHPKNGSSYKIWRERVGRLMKEKEIPLDIKEIDLTKLYHQDLCPWDVYYLIRSMSAKSCLVHILWSDDFGREEVRFSNSHDIREFLIRCERLRKLLKNGSY